MTPEELTSLVTRGDIAGIVQGLSGLDERQRQALSSTAQKLCRQEQGSYAAELAVMGTAPLSAAKRCRIDSHDALAQVLLDRHPDWLCEWVETRRFGIDWDVIRPLFDAGYLSPSASSNMMNYLVYGLFRDKMPITEAFVRHPEWREGVYRLFDADVCAFRCCDSRLDELGEKWMETIHTLCDQGQLDRGRILVMSLQVLARDLKADSIAAYIQMHEDLAPTEGEQEKLAGEYLALLANSRPVTVAFALQQLSALAKANRLDASTFMRELPRVYQCSVKGHVKTALTILKGLVKQQPELRAQAVVAAAGALAHPVEDAQDAGLKLVETWGEPGDAELAARLSTERDLVAAPLRPRIDALLARLVSSRDDHSRAATAGTDRGSPANQDWPRTIEARRPEIERLTPDLARRAGLEEGLDACRQDRLPATPVWRPLEAPILTGLEKIAPIEALDELFDAVAHALERVDHADDVERILDGISRLCDQRPPDFERRAAPLVKRIEKLLSTWGNPRHGLLAPACDRGMAPLLMAWLKGSRKVKDFTSGLAHYRDTWRVSVVERLTALAQRVEKRQAAPLLAAPTHCGGWIDPQVWAERWAVLVGLRVDVPGIELCQSLLRLAPEGRGAALQRVSGIECRRREALIWALGGPAERFAPQSSLSVWIAASRCRDPEIVLPAGEWSAALRPAAEVLQPGVYRWRAFPGSRPHGPTAGDRPLGQFELEPPLASPAERRQDVEEANQRAEEASQRKYAEIMADLMARTNQPTGEVASSAAPGDTEEAEVDTIPPGPHWLPSLSHLIDPLEGAARWVYQWAAMLWPAKMDGYWKGAVKAFLSRMDKNASALDPHSAFLDPLFAPDQPLTELAALALWIATQSKDADARTAAIDAWSTLVGDGRGDAQLLGRVLVRQGGTSRHYPNRLADALRQVTRVSPLHAWTVAEVVQDLLASLPEFSSDVCHLLQLLREVLTELGLAVRPEVRSKLEAHAGTGKTATLARQLCTLDRTESPTRQAALLQLFDARLARAQRWATSCDLP